jgi:hypothetical protein
VNAAEAVAAVDPANSPSLLPKPDGTTWCNEAIRFLLAARGVHILRAKANEQHDWLAAQPDWRKVDNVAEVEELLAAGRVVVFSWKNPTGGHGHITLGVPAPPGAHVPPGYTGLFNAGAGSHNTNCGPLEEQFGLSNHPDFFIKEE